MPVADLHEPVEMNALKEHPSAACNICMGFCLGSSCFCSCFERLGSRWLPDVLLKMSEAKLSCSFEAWAWPADHGGVVGWWLVTCGPI